MNETETMFAERLAEDLDRVLGAGIAIDDIEVVQGSDEARVVATLLIEGRVETIEARGSDLAGLYRPLVERAAQLRLASAFWRMIGPS
jgi:hypothetical protein